MQSQCNVLWSEILAYQPKDNTVPIGAHRHPFFHCFYVVDGKGSMVLEGEEIPLQKGHFYTTPPEHTHDFGARGSAPMILCEIKFELEDKEARAFLSSCPRDLDVESTPIYSILKRTRRELAEKRPYFTEIIKHNLAEILIHLKRCAEGAGEMAEDVGDDKILQTILYINSHLETEITLSDLAGRVFLEKTYFLKRFKAVLGCTPIRYARRARINKAKELLVYSDKNVTQISNALGFKSVHHFSAVFSEETGASPTLYKKQHRAH